MRGLPARSRWHVPRSPGPRDEGQLGARLAPHGAHWDAFRLEAFIQNAFDRRGILGVNSVCATQICGAYARAYPVKPQMFGIKAGDDF